MTRRTFLKWLVSVIAFIPGLSDLFERLWSKFWTQETDGATEASAEPDTPGFPAGDQLLLSLFLLSDLHISVAEDVTKDKLNLALQDIADFESPVDAIVLGGDLTDFGRDIEYGKLQSILGGYKLPTLYGNMGNHDYYDIWLDASGAFNTETAPNGKTDAMSRERFQRFIGYPDKPYHDVWLKGVHLIMLSQEAYQQEMPEVGEGAWYSDGQLEWLKARMAEHKNGEPALIFIHQPLPPRGSDGGSHRIIRANAFREIVSPYKNVFLFSGHTHRNLNTDGRYVKETFHWISNASVGRTRPVADGEGGSVSQGCYIQVYGNRVVVRGREFTNRSWIEKANWDLPLEA